MENGRKDRDVDGDISRWDAGRKRNGEVGIMVDS